MYLDFNVFLYRKQSKNLNTKKYHFTSNNAKELFPCLSSFTLEKLRIFSKTKCCKISLWLGFLLAASLLVRICFDVLINFLFLFWGQKKIENTSPDQSGRLSWFTWWDCQQGESRHGIMNNFRYKNLPFRDLCIDL